MQEKFKKLPLRSGVGIVVLNKHNQVFVAKRIDNPNNYCLLYTSPSPRDVEESRMPSSA